MALHFKCWVSMDINHQCRFLSFFCFFSTWQCMDLLALFSWRSSCKRPAAIWAVLNLWGLSGPGASFHSLLSSSDRHCCCCCCRLLVSGYFANRSWETFWLSVTTSVKSFDSGGLNLPATFHLWQVRKWEWENGEKDVKGWRSSPRQLETPFLDRIPVV